MGNDKAYDSVSGTVQPVFVLTQESASARLNAPLVNQLSRTVLSEIRSWGLA